MRRAIARIMGRPMTMAAIMMKNAIEIDAASGGIASFGKFGTPVTVTVGAWEGRGIEFGP